MSSNYPPGVTGNEPEIVGHDEPEISGDDVLGNLVARSEVEAILAAMVKVAPRWDGAHLSDVVEGAYDSDAYLADLEPVAEAHAAEWTQAHAYAGIVVVMLGRIGMPIVEGAGTWEQIVALLDRADAQIDPHEAADNGHEDCATCGLPTDHSIHEPEPADFGPTIWFRYLGASLGKSYVAVCGECSALVPVSDDDLGRHALNAHGAPSWEVRR